MDRLRGLLPAALTLLSASRLLGQSKPVDTEVYNVPVVCNDGKIPVYVARAFKALHGPFYNDQWIIQGWYLAGPGTCTEIGPEQVYSRGGLFEEDTVTLLAFAFRDAAGVWGAVRFRDTTGGIFTLSTQKLCVADGEFRVVRDAAKGEDPAAGDCGRGPLAAYYQIPASLVFKGDSFQNFFGKYMNSPHSRDYLHVSLGPNDHATPSATGGPALPTSPQSSTDGSLGTAILKAMAKAFADETKTRHPQPDTAPSTDDGLTRFRNAVRDDVAEYLEASKTGFEAYKKGDVILSAGYRMWESSVVPAIAKNCWVIQGALASTLSCLMSTSPDLTQIRGLYTELTNDVAVSVPQDWRRDPTPPFGPEFPASISFRSSSGAHGEIWIARATTGEYELHYQLVTAEVAVKQP